MLRNKRGFTLVELSIVLALTAIVVTMACGFLAKFQSSSMSINANEKAMADIINIRRMVNEFIREYDNYETVQTMSLETYILKFGNDQIAFSETEGKIIWTKNGSEYKSQTLECIDEITFKINDGETTNNVITCTVYFDDSSQDLMFNLFSNVERSRYSPSDRGDE